MSFIHTELKDSEQELVILGTNDTTHPAFHCAYSNNTYIIVMASCRSSTYVIERELLEIDQIERDLLALTHERDVLARDMKDAAGMPRTATEGSEFSTICNDMRTISSYYYRLGTDWKSSISYRWYRLGILSCEHIKWLNNSNPISSHVRTIIVQ